MRSLASPLALVLVVAIPVAFLGFVAAAERWARWMVRAGGLVGVAGLAVTAASAVNLLVPRTCSDAPVEEVNRPVISLVVGDGACFRDALGQAQLAALVGVAASVAVVTRSGRGGGGGAPAVPSR